MLPSLKLLLRIFVYTACPVGGMLGGAVALILWGDGVGRALLAGGMTAAVTGGSYGACMALLIGGCHVLAVRRLGHRLTAETLGVRHRRRLEIERPFAETFTLCLAAIRFLGNTDVEEGPDEEPGVILVTKRWSFWSFGERIRFDLRATEAGTAVEVECRPWMPTTVVDYGVSLGNMDAIVGFLLAHGAPEGDLPPKTHHVRPPRG